MLKCRSMLPSDQDGGEVVLSIKQEQQRVRGKPPDEDERLEQTREDDPYYEAFFDRKVEGVLLATATGELFDASDVACRLL